MGRVGARLGQRAPRLADLVRGLVVDVRVPVLDQVDGPGVELLEVVRRVVQVLAPVEAQPADVGLDRVDVLLLLLDRVGVVEPEVAVAAELLRDAEVERDRLRMADVEVAVGLGREPRDDRPDAAGAHVGGHDVADEVGPLRGGGLEAVESVVMARSCYRCGRSRDSREGRTTLPGELADAPGIEPRSSRLSAGRSP